MTARIVSSLLKEFAALQKESRLAAETQKGITSLIKAAPELKTGEKRVAEVVEDLAQRANVIRAVRINLPKTKEFIGIDTPEFRSKQLITAPFNVNRKQEFLDIKKEKVNEIKSYLKNTTANIKKGVGSFEDLLLPKIIENTGVGASYIKKAKRDLGGTGKILGPNLKEIYDYFKHFAASEKFKRMRGGVDFNLDEVIKLKEQNRIQKIGRVTSPEGAVARFLYRSSLSPVSDVKLLNQDVGSKFSQMKFLYGGRKIDYKDIKDGIKQNDPLFSEVADAFNYKREALKTKVMNPKTGMLEPLNKVSFDVLGTRGSGLFHMSHIYDVGRTPLQHIQVTYGPYNLQLNSLLKKMKKGDVESFLTRAKQKNVANPLAPDYIKVPPQQFANEASLKLNEFYKLKKNNKNVNWDAFLKLKKGGIVDLIRKVN